MADIFHIFGADLAIGPTGDLAIAGSATEARQRVLRRLLTNPGDYIWHPSYGAGLAQFIGQPANVARITAVIRGQIFKEAAVARTPEPQIAVQAGTDGTFAVQIRYTDATGGGAQMLNFIVGG